MADQTDNRIRKDLSVARGSRAAEDRRLSEDRTLTDDARFEMFRRELYNDALPNLPEIPGYHCCWLSTNYQGGDTIHKRMRLGYELIRSDELPGFDHISLKTGEYAGCIGSTKWWRRKSPRAFTGAICEFPTTSSREKRQKPLTGSWTNSAKKLHATGAALRPT